MKSPHFLLVTYPMQSHINPALQFAKRVLQTGAKVTFATCISAYRRMTKDPLPEGLTFASISDGYDDGFQKEGTKSIDTYMSTLRKRGAETLTELIHKCADEGRPVDSLVYTIMLPWTAQVARDLNLPAACLWIQPAALLDIYYYYFHGYSDDIIENSTNDPSWSFQVPDLPFQLQKHELPSFLVPDNPYTFALPEFQEQFEVLDSEEPKPRIFVNSFDALEPQALKSIEKFDVVAVGPLLPSAFLDGCDPSDKSFGAELFKRPKDYMKWLDSKEKSSVIYISFGSISVLSKKQKQETAHALLECGRPFLWVIRHNIISGQEVEEKEEDKLDRLEELEQQGLIVPWCSQVEVLSHPSIGCFLTHCGWNSSLESLASGVPMVCFPQWTDQPTNAKLIEDLWKTGVRVKPNHEQEGIVESGEIKRCLEIVMEDEDMRRNAKKWRELAIEATKEGGSSDRNLKAFVQEVAKAQN